MATVYISIGNSDDKLTQLEWYEFYRDVDNAVRFADYSALGLGVPVVHGAWTSLPIVPWQNACWCVELTDKLAERLRRMLRLYALEYRQDSIAWAEATTEFLTPGGAA